MVRKTGTRESYWAAAEHLRPRQRGLDVIPEAFGDGRGMRVVLEQQAGQGSWRQPATGVPPVRDVRMTSRQGGGCSFRGKVSQRETPESLAWATRSWVCVMHGNKENARKADLGAEEGSAWHAGSLRHWRGIGVTVLGRSGAGQDQGEEGLGM